MLRTRSAIALNERASCLVSFGPCSSTCVDISPYAKRSVAFRKFVNGRDITDASKKAANTAIATETPAATTIERTRSATRASIMLFG